jgi:peptidoglycan/LPS O-acetylase OafA/YrhL
MMSAHALSTWLTVLGALGLALRFLGRPRPVVRYLADSSYWLYLVHPPLVIGLQIQLAAVELPAGLKFLAIHLLALPLLLASYQLFARDTLIGRVLNGTRAASSHSVSSQSS